MLSLHQASFQFTFWAEIKLNQMVPSAWRKIEQYANKHFTFCLQCKIMGDEDIKILLCDLVRNHYKILVIWTIDAFESVQCSDHAKQKTTTKNLWLIISNVLSFQFPSLEWSQAVSYFKQWEHLKWIPMCQVMTKSIIESPVFLSICCSIENLYSIPSLKDGEHKN